MELEHPARLYSDTREAALQLFRSLTIEQADTQVALSPEWTVRDVAAHVCGIVDDVVNENTAGLGTDEWTAAQVASRRGRSLTEICDEWEGLGPEVDEMIAGNVYFGIRITGDLIIHVQDVQHALGLPTDPDNLATRAAAHRYVPSLQERALEQQNLAVTVDLTDGDTYTAIVSEESEPTATLALSATSYDFLRSVTGRRSRRQVEALDWTGDPTALLDAAWNTYGPMRSEDVSA